MPKRKLSGSRSASRPAKRTNVKAKKWKTLEHKGPRFPSPYKRMRGYKLLYNGRPIKLSEEAEEAAVMYAKFLRTHPNPRATLKKNFFADWLERMTRKERDRIKDFDLCDFDEIIEYLEETGQAKRDMSPAEKAKLKKEQEKKLKKHRNVYVDGVLQLVNNCTVEPPGIFLGRGTNKNIGKIKKRIQPEDVTINCSENCRIPAPKGHTWKERICDPTGVTKYVDLHSSSRLKSLSEEEKFEKSEDLADCISRIRRKYTQDLKSEDVAKFQKATATYFIDKLALRVGNEKGKGETDTVGCCSLRVQHIQLLDNSTIFLKFNGKDSVPYEKEIRVSKNVYDNLKELVRRKRKNELLFDEITTQSLNQYISSLGCNYGGIEGLTAKVFRTYRATQCYEEELLKLSERVNLSIKNDELLDAMLLQCQKKANLVVAKLLNHQNMVNKRGKRKVVEKFEEKVENVKRKIKEAKHKLTTGRNLPHEQRQMLKQRLEKLEEELKVKKGELELKEELVDYALGTSKLNYINPCKTLRWCRDNGIEFSKVYSKTHLKRFNWAVTKVEEDEEIDDDDEMEWD